MSSTKPMLNVHVITGSCWTGRSYQACQLAMKLTESLGIVAVSLDASLDFSARSSVSADTINPIDKPITTELLTHVKERNVSEPYKQTDVVILDDIDIYVTDYATLILGLKELGVKHVIATFRSRKTNVSEITFLESLGESNVTHYYTTRKSGSKKTKLVRVYISDTDERFTDDQRPVINAMLERFGKQVDALSEQELSDLRKNFFVTGNKPFLLAETGENPGGKQKVEGVSLKRNDLSDSDKLVLGNSIQDVVDKLGEAHVAVDAEQPTLKLDDQCGEPFMIVQIGRFGQPITLRPPTILSLDSLSCAEIQPLPAVHLPFVGRGSVQILGRGLEWKKSKKKGKGKKGKRKSKK